MPGPGLPSATPGATAGPAVDALRAQGEAVPDEALTHLSPLAWEQVNFLGQYAFDPAAAHALDDRRPRRGGAEAGGLEAEADA